MRNNILSRIFLCFGIFISATSCLYAAKKSSDIGIDSNILTYDNKVVFLEMDGGITVINKETGDLIERHKGKYVSNSIHMFENRIIIIKFDEVYVLDESYNVDYRFKAYKSVIVGSSILSTTGNGSVQAFNIKTGDNLWKYNLPKGVSSISVPENSEVVLVTYKNYLTSNIDIILLDVNSGEELFKIVYNVTSSIISAFIDSKNIYLALGNTNEVGVYDFNGTFVSKHSVPKGYETLNDIPGNEDLLIQFNEKILCQGKVWESVENIPPSHLGSYKIISSLLEHDLSSTKKYRFYVNKGDFKGISNSWLSDNKYVNKYIVEYKSKKIGWTKELEYLKNGGRIKYVTQDDHYLIWGTDNGRVECVNTNSGKTKWLYLSPLIK